MREKVRRGSGERAWHLGRMGWVAEPQREAPECPNELGCCLPDAFLYIVHGPEAHHPDLLKPRRDLIPASSLEASDKQDAQALVHTWGRSVCQVRTWRRSAIPAQQASRFRQSLPPISLNSSVHI